MTTHNDNQTLTWPDNAWFSDAVKGRSEPIVTACSYSLMRKFRVDQINWLALNWRPDPKDASMLQTSIALIIFLFPLAYSPGPGNMFFATNGARFGFRSTVPSNVGYHLATWIVTAAIGFGFIAALDRFPQIFVFLKTSGSLYVLWIAWKIFRAGALEGHEAAKPATFIDGVILLVLNPKAYVIIALMFTQFLGQSEGGWVVTVILITTVFTINNLISFSIWALIGDKIAGYFRTPESAQRLNMLFGMILATVAVWMFLS
jgi:threonine/homoserine/homoserine lactone efflux protein